MPYTGNKFNVIAYLFGGLGNFSHFIPLRNDASPYNMLERWWTSRPAHRYGIQAPPNEDVFDEATVLAALSATTLGTTPINFALHPELLPLMDAWNAGHMAIWPNIGPLGQPMPDRVGYPAAPLPTGTYRIPKGVGAHDSFQIHHTYMTVTQEQFPYGWVGRMSDFFNTDPNLSLNGQAITSSINNRWPISGMARGLSTSPFALPAANGVTVDMTCGNGTSVANVVKARLAAAINLPRPGNPRATAWQNAFNATINGITFYNPIQMTAKGAGGPDFAVDAEFSAITNAGWWYDIWWRVARIVEAAIDLETGGDPIRMNILLSQGDYDTHSNEKVRFEGGTGFTGRGLLPELAQGMADFRLAMQALGCFDDVVVTNPGDFGRNLWTNGGLGTDHAWGYTLWAMGGAVRGKGVDGSTGLLGDFPAIIDINNEGTRDWQKGGIIYPNDPIEAAYDPIAEWMGLTEAQRDEVFPNITAGGFDRSAFVPLFATAPSYVPPLDGISWAPQIALSPRQLSSAYTSSTIRLRRTDLAEQDATMAGGEVDIAAMESYVGADGFAVRVYDQTLGTTLGAVAANQPRIRQSSANKLINGKLALQPQTAGLGLSSTDHLLVSATDFTIFLVALVPTFTSSLRDLYRNDPGTGMQLRLVDTSSRVRHEHGGAAYQTAVNSNIPGADCRLYVIRRTGSTVEVFINNMVTPIDSQSSSTALDTSRYQFFTGHTDRLYGDCLMGPSAISNGELVTLGNRLKAYWGIA